MLGLESGILSESTHRFTEPGPHSEINRFISAPLLALSAYFACKVFSTVRVYPADKKTMGFSAESTLFHSINTVPLFHAEHEH
jgi:hypothetical protein